jgi:hypothetical protein
MAASVACALGGAALLFAPTRAFADAPLLPGPQQQIPPGNIIVHLHGRIVIINGAQAQMPIPGQGIDADDSTEPTRTATAAEPATQPSTYSQADLQTLLAKTDDDDDTARDKARVTLMGLHRSDLALLHAAAVAAAPLSPEQIAALHEIVEQVYLSEEPYQADSNIGFLGLRWTMGARTYVLVEDRVCGFCACRMLQGGDLILNIEEMPQPELTSDEFIEAIRRLPVGATVHLDVIRRGRRIQIPLQLGPRPHGITLESFPQWMQTRQEKAEQYWQQNYSSLTRGDDLTAGAE